MTDRDRSETERLVARAKRGDADALDRLFSDAAGQVRAWIRARLDRKIQARVGASDVAQRAFIAAYSALPRFEYRGPGSFRRWLHQVVRSQLLATVREHIGADKRNPKLEVPASAAGVAQADETTPSCVLLHGERKQMVLQALAELSPDYAEIVRLVFYERMKVKVAAAEMGRSEAAGQKLLSRALAQLRKIGRQHGLTDEESEGGIRH